jgi:hypothetical protein
MELSCKQYTSKVLEHKSSSKLINLVEEPSEWSRDTPHAPWPESCLLQCCGQQPVRALERLWEGQGGKATQAAAVLVLQDETQLLTCIVLISRQRSCSWFRFIRTNHPVAVAFFAVAAEAGQRKRQQSSCRHCKRMAEELSQTLDSRRQPLAPSNHRH